MGSAKSLSVKLQEYPLLSRESSSGRENCLQSLVPLCCASFSKTESKQTVKRVTPESKANVVVFKYVHLGTQKEIMQCYSPIYNSQRKRQNNPVHAHKHMLTEVLLQPLKARLP